jgi:hypothetical protein
MDSRRSKNENRRRRWPRGRRGNPDKGGGDGKSVILESLEGGGEKREDKDGYHDKPRENHGKAQDYHHKERIRMQGLSATTRTMMTMHPSLSTAAMIDLPRGHI